MSNPIVSLLSVEQIAHVSAGNDLESDSITAEVSKNVGREGNILLYPERFFLGTSAQQAGMHFGRTESTTHRTEC